MSRTYSNPVLAGCYPDPSICRVGEDYYLVTSTFEYFPGLPVLHSRDLVHWRLLGHVIDRPGQLDLTGVPSSRGLYAPTIRHHDGVFYVLNTLVEAPEGTPSGNFVVTATDPAGPWSDPVWLEEAPGFDPSLFVDAGGRGWVTWTRPAEEPEWPGQANVWLRELDLATLALVGPTTLLWNGAVRGGVWCESPHLYEVDGRYLLLTAEGGTEIHHAVVVAASDEITGPYVGDKANPVLTHRDLGRRADVVGVGHADLVEAHDGTWWAVLLAMRPYGGYHYPLGRETFLVPVGWEDGWPRFAPGTGRVRLREDAPALPEHPWPAPPERETFDGGLPAAWTSLRGPADGFAGAAPGGGLRLDLRAATLAEIGVPAFVGRRQEHADLDVAVRLRFAPTGAHEAVGLVVRQSEADHYTALVTGGAAPGDPRRLVVTRRRAEVETVLANVPVDDQRAPDPDSPVDLGLRVRGQDYTVVLGGPGEEREVVTLDGRILDSTVAGGFLGVWLGLVATSNGRPTTSSAVVEWFDYRPAAE